MLSVEEALGLMLAESRPLPPREGTLDEAGGRRLAEDVHADADQPPFDKALVDGYAVRVADLESGGPRLRLGETILAGQVPRRPIETGEAAAIMTGAPIPPGADAVVMIEHTRMIEGRIAIEMNPGVVVQGRNILPRGRVWRTGEVLLAAGQRLTPAAIGTLAAVGRSHIRFIPRPSVAIVPTGDELVEPHQAPGPGQVRNSNSPMLAAMALERGAIVTRCPIAPDEPHALRLALDPALDQDILLITGGVSAGQRDLVPFVLEKLGVRRVLHKIRLRPGKPLWFGVGPSRGNAPGTLVFGLPGNPVSGLVGFLLFVEPALRVLSGERPPPAKVPLVMVRLARRFVHRGDRPSFLPGCRVGVEGDPNGPESVEVIDWAGSADLLGPSRADGFVAFPAGSRAFEAGEIVGFLPLG